MQNSRSTIAALFAAIVQLAQMLVSLFKVADDAVGMLDRAVGDAKERQLVRSAVDMTTYEATYRESAAKTLAESRRQISEYSNRSPEHFESYQTALDELKEALAIKRAQARGQTLSAA